MAPFKLLNVDNPKLIEILLELRYSVSNVLASINARG